MYKRWLSRILFVSAILAFFIAGCGTGVNSRAVPIDPSDTNPTKFQTDDGTVTSTPNVYLDDTWEFGVIDEETGETIEIVECDVTDSQSNSCSDCGSVTVSTTRGTYIAPSTMPDSGNQVVIDCTLYTIPTTTSRISVVLRVESGGGGGGGDVTGDGKSWGSATSLIASNSTTPTVEVDSNGNALALWTDSSGDVDVDRVRSSFYIFGGDWGASEVVSNDAVNCRNPDVEFDSDGNAYTAWYTSTGGFGDIFANIYDTATGWGDDEELYDGAVTLASVDSPSIAVNSSGTAMAVWPLANGDVYAARYSDGSWGAAERIYNGGLATGPHVGIDSDGNAIAVWEDEVAYAARYTPAGGWGAEEALYVGGGINGLAFSMNADGNAVAVWNRGNSQIEASIYTSGSGWSDRVEIDNVDGVATPDVDMDSSGNARAVWVETDIPGTAGQIGTVTYTWGTGWGTPETISANSAGGTLPKLRMNATGKTVAVWVKDSAVWSSRFIVDLGWIEDEQIASSGSSPEVTVDSNGNAVCVYLNSGVEAVLLQ